MPNQQPQRSDRNRTHNSHLARFGGKRHELTPADRRRGGLKGAATRAAKLEEARKSSLDRMRELVERDAEKIIAPYLAAIKDGDWRAAEALMDRIYGRPTQRNENIDATALVAFSDMSEGELARLAGLLTRKLELQAVNGGKTETEATGS